MSLGLRTFVGSWQGSTACHTWDTGSNLISNSLNCCMKEAVELQEQLMNSLTQLDTLRIQASGL